MIERIIQAIFCIQFFFAGHYFASEMRWARTKAEKALVYLTVFSIGLAGTLILAIGAILYPLGWIWHKVIRKYHIWFIVKYILLKRPLDYNRERGEELHQRAIELNPKWYQIDDRIFVWINNWVDPNYRSKEVHP